MNRRETTAFLSELVRRRLRQESCYWADEVCLDYGTTDVRRIDFMSFAPDSVVSVSGIEKGIFTCYEVKSCKADYNSGYGMNFVCEKNYLVMTMNTYKEIMYDEKLPWHVGILVPVPFGDKLEDEFHNPTDYTNDINFELKIIKPSHPQLRKRSITELLFTMLRARQRMPEEVSE